MSALIIPCLILFPTPHVQEIGELGLLRELHLQGNRLTVLPPSLGSLDFLSSRSILKLDNNPWVPPIEDQLMLGVSHVIEYIRTGDLVLLSAKQTYIS